MEAAIRTAREGGFVGPELRALANLSAIAAGDDPRRARQVAIDALALARRVGHRMMSNWLVSNVMISAFGAGDDWEAAIADGEEALASVSDPSDEQRILTYVTLLRLSRGDPVDDAIRRLEELETTGDPGDAQTLRIIRAIRLLEAGEHDRAFDEAFGGVDLFSAFAAACLRVAGRAALASGDLDRARQVAARIDALPGSSADLKLFRAAARAGVAALEGRTQEAVATYRDVVRRALERGEGFEAATDATQLVVLVGAADPAVQAMADDARALFERVGARPWLALLEAAMAGPPVAGHAAVSAEAAATTGAGSTAVDAPTVRG
jgi:tetratricopeptide (TPR) repeat protein